MNHLEPNSPLVVLIGGCHASGKRTASMRITEELHMRFPHLNTVEIDMLDYLTKSPTQSHSPAQFDFQLMVEDISTKYKDMDVVLLFGLYALYDQRIRDLATISVYIDCDSDVRLGRWIKRDVLCLPKEDQQRKLESVMDSYLNFSRDEMKRSISPTKEYADVILPRGADATGVAIIVDGLQPLIESRLTLNLLDKSKMTSSASLVDDRSVSSNSTNRGNLLSPQVTPSVLSLSQDNFTNQNKRFYDIN